MRAAVSFHIVARLVSGLLFAMPMGRVASFSEG